MSVETIVAASIVSFMKQQLEDSTLSPDTYEDFEEAIDSIETHFELETRDSALAVDLVALVSNAQGAAGAALPGFPKTAINAVVELLRYPFIRNDMKSALMSGELLPELGGQVAFSAREASVLVEAFQVVMQHIQAANQDPPGPTPPQ